MVECGTQTHGEREIDHETDAAGSNEEERQRHTAYHQGG